MREKKKLTKRETDTLETMLETAQWRMQKEITAWPNSIMDDAIGDMWGGFWMIVPPERLTRKSWQ